MVRMRLERNIRRCSLRARARLFKRIRLGMLDVFKDVEPLAYHLPRGIRDDTTN
jgi:hypothetical protein